MNAAAAAIVAGAALAGILGLVALARRSYRRSGRRAPAPEAAFALAFALISALSIVAIPGFTTADEAHHFLRAYGVAHGAWVESDENPDAARVLARGDGSAERFLLVGDYFAEGVLPYADEPPAIDDLTGAAAQDITLSSIAATWDARTGDDEMFYGFANTALYSPVSYLPQALAIALVDLVSDQSWLLYYAARIAMALTYGVLCFLAIRAIPRGKHLLAAIALAPRAVTEANSVGADAFALALCLLLVALVLKRRHDTAPLGPWRIAGLAAICTCIALCKIVYLPVVFLVLLVPRERYRSRGGVFIALGVVVVACAANLAWLAISAGILGRTPMNAGADSPAQLALILGDPLGYVVVVGSTVAQMGLRWLGGAFASSYFFGAVRMPEAFTLAPCALVALAWLFDREGPRLAKAVRIAFAAVFVAVFLLVLTSLYLQWNSVGASVVDGVQGRYFLPVALPLLLAVQPDKQRLERLAQGWPNVAFYSCCLAVSTISLYAPLVQALG